MPNLSEVSPQSWLQMKLSTRTQTYQMFDWIRGLGHEPIGDYSAIAAEMIEAGWLGRDGDKYFVTLAGQDHLRG